MIIVEEKGIEVADKPTPKEKVFNDAKDKNVAAPIVYKNGAALYYDENFTNEVPFEDLLDLFLKGVVLKKGDTYAAAMGFDGVEIVFNSMTATQQAGGNPTA